MNGEIVDNRVKLLHPDPEKPDSPDQATQPGAIDGDLDHASGKFDVWFIPFDLNNPYQRDLAAHLGELGIKVGQRKNLGETITESLLGSNSTIIHLHWLPRFSPGWRGWVRASIYVAQLRLLRLLGRQIVWTIHNLYHHEAVSRSTDRWVHSQLFKLASHLVVHSPSARDSVVREFAATGQSKISVIPHGNYLHAYENRASRAEARATLGLPETALVFLSLGWLRPYKGLEGLIRAFRESQGDHKRLVIAGKAVDPAFAELLRREAEADPRIILKLERVPDEDIQIFMNAADAVVLPYREILTSGAVVLAMSFGRACVAPKIGCIPDLLDQNGAILYDPDHERGLADALEAVEANRQHLAQMGDHNLAVARTWGWDRVAAETAKLYQLPDRQPGPQSAASAANEQAAWDGQLSPEVQQLRQSSRD
jgi:beta-1,4-mannosyltransferase